MSKIHKLGCSLFGTEKDETIMTAHCVIVFM